MTQALGKVEVGYTTAGGISGGLMEGCAITPLSGDRALLLDQQYLGTSPGISGGTLFGAWTVNGAGFVANSTLTVRASLIGDPLCQVQFVLGFPIPTSTNFFHWRIPYRAYVSSGSSPISSVTLTGGWFDAFDVWQSGDLTIDISGLAGASTVTGDIVVTQDYGTRFKYTVNAYTNYVPATNAIGCEITIDDMPLWQTRARIASFTADGWVTTSGTVITGETTFDYAGSEVARATAVTDEGNVVMMTGRGERGYRLLEISGDTVAAHDVVPVRQGPTFGGTDYNVRTRNGQRGAALGSNQFVFLRKTDDYQLAEAISVSGTTITIDDVISLSRPNTLGDGWGTVLATSSTTALAATAHPTGEGVTTPKLRIYELTLTGGALTQAHHDVAFSTTYHDYTEIYRPAPTATYDVEVVVHKGDDSLGRYAITWGTSSLTETSLPLAALDMSVRPDGVSSTGTTLLIRDDTAAAYVVTADSLIIANSVFILATPDDPGGRTMVTQYDYATGEIVATFWDRGPNTFDGMGQQDLDGYYDDSLRQVVLQWTGAYLTGSKVQFHFSLADAPIGEIRMLDLGVLDLVFDLADGGYVQRTRFV